MTIKPSKNIYSIKESDFQMKALTDFFKKYREMLLWALLTLAAGGLGALLSGGFEIYKLSVKPPLSPPATVFPIAWSLLYILIGISAGKVAASRDLDRERALKLYIVQLAINVVWPIIFFRFEALKLACFWLALLVFAALCTFSAFKKINKRVAWLFLPYLAWLIFALYLNFGVAALN